MVASLLNLTCPTCGHRMDHVPKKVCAECGKPIQRNHKYVFCSDGRIRHRSCEDPEAYLRSVAKASIPIT